MRAEAGGFGGFIPFEGLARVFADAPVSGRLRLEPGDFRVDEKLGFEPGFEPGGEGPHHWLLVCKTGYTTPFVTRVLAERYAVPVRDIGFSGLKDRHAVTTQWFSVPARPGAPEPKPGEIAPGVRIVRAERGRKKLRRGVHAENRFAIVLREVGKSGETGKHSRLASSSSRAKGCRTISEASASDGAQTTSLRRPGCCEVRRSRQAG